MSKIKYKLLRESLHVQYYFKRPIFQWQELAARFFQMIYDVLGARLNIQPAEFTINPAHSLSEARVRYVIYGGTTSVTLLADRLAFDFPNLLPTDLGLVLEILAAVHDAFPKAFPEVEQARIEVQEFAHLDIGTQEAVTEFLNAYRIASVDDTFGDFPVINTPAIKYALVAQDARWKSTVVVEPSQLATTALFGSVATTLLNVPAAQTYLEKAALVQTITARCLAALNLEIENGS